MANWFQLFGLVLDFVGVYLMAKDILRVDINNIPGTLGWSSKAKENDERTKSLTKRGLIFLGVGFVLQAVGTIINICNTP